MPDDRNLLDPTTGDEPSNEFVDSLWKHLDAAWDERGDTDGDTSAAHVTAVEFEEPAPRRYPRALLTVAAAAIVVVVVGLIAFTSRDEEGGTETVDQPDEPRVEVSEEEPRQPPTPSAPRWTRCQSFGVPSAAEYWHIGETTDRLINVVPRTWNGTNMGAGTSAVSGQPRASAYSALTAATNAGSRRARLS